nr:uncharacterized protein LOC111506013 [Leptinotarsa decemlineata]XP_023016698.1 uncharacterized protein LOC111506013 [Leptinotarsa decemlineata]
MSQISTEENEGVQYILNDDDFVLDTTDEGEDLNDVILSDGTRAILVNGHILQSDPQTIFLQEGDDISQYLINTNDGGILIADTENTTDAQKTDDTEVIQYIDDEGNFVSEPTNILYVNEDGVPIKEEDLVNYEIAQSIEPEEENYQTQVINPSQLLTKQESEEYFANILDQNEYQYAILKDGNLHIQTVPAEAGQVSELECSDVPTLDVSNIRGTNLLTGQSVSLEGYIEKITKKIGTCNPYTLIGEESNNRKRRVKKSLKGLLNMKLNLGVTSSGKRLVGKVVHVGTKEVSSKKENQKKLLPDCKNETHAGPIQIPSQQSKSPDGCSGASGDRLTTVPLAVGACGIDSVNNDHSMYSRSIESMVEPPPLLNVISQDSASFRQMADTLTNLMSTDNLKTKLQEKTLMISVVEGNDQSSEEPTKNIFHCSGHMEVESGYDEHGNYLENWSFVPYHNVEELFQSRSFQDKKINSSTCKYEDVTNVSLINTLQKNNKRLIRVVIDPENMCFKCHKDFQSNRNLKDHLENIHFQCSVCEKSFKSIQDVRQHKQEHTKTGKLFICANDECHKLFASKDLLLQHTKTHKLEALEQQDTQDYSCSEPVLKKLLYKCEICSKAFCSIRDMNFHKNITHTSKLYGCEICKRSFSRYANLQRHAEIHKGSAEMFSCDICGCSYHYMSSLTRHVVNTHIKTVEADKTT